MITRSLTIGNKRPHHLVTPLESLICSNIASVRRMLVCFASGLILWPFLPVGRATSIGRRVLASIQEDPRRRQGKTSACSSCSSTTARCRSQSVGTSSMEPIKDHMPVLSAIEWTFRLDLEQSANFSLARNDLWIGRMPVWVTQTIALLVV